MVLSIATASVAQAKTILVLGDSLSAGYNIDVNTGWVNLLARQLPQDTMINASISGATSAQGLQILPGLLARHKPEVMLLELGANDGLQGKPIASIRANLRQLIQLAQQQQVQVVLLGIRLPPNLGKRYVEPFYALYGELAAEFKLQYVPFLLEGVADKTEWMQRDGLHPNAEGQTRILANVVKALPPSLKLVP